MSKQLTETSKFLSYVLRHKPHAIGVALDSEGWIEIDALIDGAIKHGTALDRDLIQQVVATSEKKRFTISEDGLRIRAVQGHSTDSVAISYVEMLPPEFLFHGTATCFLESIQQQGLLPGARHYVHLSEDIQTATAVGQRYGKPVVLKLEALRMHQQGFKFYQAENGVWLTDQVPPKFLTLSSSNMADSAITSRQPKLST